MLMSQIPAGLDGVFASIREERKSARMSALTGDKRAHIRTLMEELNRANVLVDDDTFEVLKHVHCEAPAPDDKIDLLCPEPITSGEVVVVDLLRVNEMLVQEKLEWAEISDIPVCLRKYRDKIKPVGMEVLFQDKSTKVCQLMFILESKKKHWLLVLGMMTDGRLFLGAEPMVRGVVAGSMIPVRRP